MREQDSGRFIGKSGCVAGQVDQVGHFGGNVVGDAYFLVAGHHIKNGIVVLEGKFVQAFRVLYMSATFYCTNDKKKEKIGVDDQLLLAQESALSIAPEASELSALAVHKKNFAFSALFHDGN